MTSFEQPHKKIHDIAAKAFQLQKEGQKSEAIALIESTRNRELKEMIRLFADIKNVYRKMNREVLLLLDIEFVEQTFALIVDEVIAVADLPKRALKSLDDTLAFFNQASRMILGVGEFPEISSPTIVMDAIRCTEATL